MKAIKAGIPVFCEKPLCLNLEEANELVRPFASTIPLCRRPHTYLGHWTTRFCRYIVRGGLLGDVRWVDSYYLQGWLATKLEASGQNAGRLAHQSRNWPAVLDAAAISARTP